LDRYAGPLETAFGSAGVRYAREGWIRLPRTAYGAALCSVLRFAWLGADRAALFAFLRSPFSDLQRHQVDFAEGRLRGRAISQPERVAEEIEKLRPGAMRAVEALRSEPDPVTAVRDLARRMSGAAHPANEPAASEEMRRDLRAFEAVHRLLDELDGWRRLGGEVSQEAVVAAPQGATVPGAPAGGAGPGAGADPAGAPATRLQIG